MTRPDRLLSVDPGVYRYGVAVWNDGRLISAQLVERNTGAIEDLFHNADLLRVIIERPQIYRTSKNPNDLGELALAAGEFGGYARAFARNPEVGYIYPAAWKGQLEKDESARRVIDLLSHDEINRIPKLGKTDSHNVYDAIGIGLVYLGRARRGVIGKRKAS